MKQTSWVNQWLETTKYGMTNNVKHKQMDVTKFYVFKRRLPTAAFSRLEGCRGSAGFFVNQRPVVGVRTHVAVMQMLLLHCCIRLLR